MNGNALNFFFKYPETGNVKTRLAKNLGNKFVFDLYCHFLNDIFSTCKLVNAETVISCSTSPELYDIKPFWDKDITVLVQHGDDLGERMFNSFKSVFNLGYDNCVIIGSDSPDLSVEILNDAFKRLKENDIVLGPTSDGGYYLIGLNKDKINFSIFEGVEWSTEEVLDKTVENIKSIRLTYSILPQWNDIDELDDLIYFFNKNKNKNKPVKLKTMKFLFDNIDVFNGKKIKN